MDCRTLLVSTTCALVFSNASAASSSTVAISQAKKFFGGVVENATLATFSGVSYLTFANRPYRNGYISVTLARKVGETYTKIWSKTTESSDETSQPFESLSLSDVNGDRLPEVLYSISYHGNAAESQEYVLYNSSNRKLYISLIEGEYSTGEYQANFSPPLLEPGQEKLLSLVEKTMRSSAMYVNVKSGTPDTAMSRWKKRYGAFSSGVSGVAFIEPEWLKGQECDVRDIGPGKSIFSRAKISGYEYVSFFKGPVLAVDHAKNRCYIVYVPYSQYDWINPLETKSGKLILKDRLDGHIIAIFDPATKTLRR